jgi:F420-dependent oxidoreductase-like protein
MRIGIGIGEISREVAGVEDLIVQAQRAEEEGFASAWIAHVMGIDALTALALCGRETSRIELGTAVVPTYPRHPAAMAQQALSVQAACGGRLALGIGLSHQVVIEGMLGLSWARPYSHMKEYMAVLAPLIREGKVTFAGEEFQVNTELSVTGATVCPILLAALAPKMLALAGSQGDGTITWMTGLKTLQEHTVPRINEAAAAAGRGAPRIVAGLPITVTNEVETARKRAARVFELYGSLPSYRAMLELEGVESPADIAIMGDEDTVGERLSRLSDIGVTDLLAVPYAVGENKPASLERTRALLVSLAND